MGDRGIDFGAVYFFGKRRDLEECLKIAMVQVVSACFLMRVKKHAQIIVPLLLPSPNASRAAHRITRFSDSLAMRGAVVKADIRSDFHHRYIKTGIGAYREQVLGTERQEVEWKHDEMLGM